MADQRDERFKIEGDPEDVLKSLMDTGRPPEFVVTLTEAEGSRDFPEGPTPANEPTPDFRVFEWRGHVPDAEAANEAALDAWAKKYGERPRNARAMIHRVDGS
jgi:hypothetical protein